MSKIATPDRTVLPTPSLLIGRDRLTNATGGTYEHVYAATGTPLGEVPLAGPAEIDLAVKAAREALPAWRGTSIPQRRNAMVRLAELLTTNAQELALLSVLDNSVPISANALGPLSAADHISYYAGWMDKIGGEVVPTWAGPSFDYAIDEPYGVVGAIIPWNGPIYAAGQVLGPILAAGNCVVVKPPELAPWSLIRFGELCLEAGFPPGVVNVVPGGPSAGDALVRHPNIDKISFTGSGATARAVLAAAATNLTPVHLELGGKSANIIFPDADLDAAAMFAATMGVVANAGQFCTCPSRLLVHDDIYDTILERVATILGQLPIGDPAEPATAMGPVISARACDRIVNVIDRARQDGAGRLVVGGERMGGDLAEGFYIAPTVFAEVDPASSLFREEIFGPVLAVVRFREDTEALTLANDTNYGLAAFVHTSDVKRAHTAASTLDAGSIWINGFGGLGPAAPFGGVKQSGFGRLGGAAGLREFLRPKNVWISLG